MGAENREPSSGERIRRETIFAPVFANELLSLQEQEIPWVWDTFIAEGSLTLLVAFMKVGKSTLVTKLAISVAQGEHFLDRATRKGGVLILALEEHPRDVIRRLIRFGIKPEDRIFVHAASLKNVPTVIEAIRSFIEENGISLIIVDSLSRFLQSRMRMIMRPSRPRWRRCWT